MSTSDTQRATQRVAHGSHLINQETNDHAAARTSFSAGGSQSPRPRDGGLPEEPGQGGDIRLPQRSEDRRKGGLPPEYNEYAELSRQTVDFMELDGMTVSETLYDVVYDDNGTNGDRVQLITDSDTGEVVQRLEYDAFARVVSDSAPGTQPFGFGGGFYDRETLLLRFGARDYSGALGRWLARDPVRFSDGQLVYLFAHADPVNRWDVTDLSSGSWGCAFASPHFVAQCSACVGLVGAAILDPELASKAALAGMAATQCLNCPLAFKLMDDACSGDDRPNEEEETCGD